MPYLHHRYKSVKRKISQKTQNICYKLLVVMHLQLQFDLILIYIKATMDNNKILFLVTAAILKAGQGCKTQF